MPSCIQTPPLFFQRSLHHIFTPSPSAKSSKGTGEIMLRNLQRYLQLRWNQGSAKGILLFALGSMLSAAPVFAQLGNSGSIEGAVKDPSGSSVAGAKVEIANPISGFRRETVTGTDGNFRFSNVPFNPYHLVVTAPGFASSTQDVDVRSSVPVSMQIGLKVGTAATSITVEANGGDMVENDPSFHTDVDTSLTDRMPLESQSSSVSSLVTLAT